MGHEQQISLEILQNLNGCQNEHKTSHWHYVDYWSRLRRLYVFSSFMDENDLSHVHDETSIIPSILNTLLINGKHGKLICCNVTLTLSGNFAD